MEKNLLFICKHPENEHEFLEAMKGKDVEIDTASNGLEATACVKKKEYQVVVTGLTMEGYNGEQIISYLNKHHPNTVCIIFTTTISTAQLYFLINQRDVFRIFLRPVDYQKDFLPALDEAYEYYEVRAAELREQETELKESELLEQECGELVQRNKHRNELHENMDRYMKRLLGNVTSRYGASLSEEARKRLRNVEREIVHLCCEAEDESENLAKAENALKNIQQLAGL